MRLLAIDSATEFCSAALSTEADIISRGEELPRQHSQMLLPYVNELLSEAGVTLKELDGIVVSQGPGSFTGVRIGASIAQGLAFSQNLPMVQISTLAAMAQACYRRHGATQVIAAIDARMGEVYCGTYRLIDGLMELEGEEIVCAPADVRDRLPILGDALSVEPKVEQARAWTTCGTAWETYAEVMTEALAGIPLQSSQVRLPHAMDMLVLARPIFAAGEAIGAMDLSPNYLRNEVTWQKLPGR